MDTSESQVVTDEYALYCGDCCDIIKEIPKESVGLSVFSPPFSNLYSYSDDHADMGNCKDYREFFDHFDYLICELLRVMIPGRIVAVHCMDLPTHKSDEGYIGLYDFSGDIIRAFQRFGFIFHSRHCIWKDPLIAATRTKALGLMHKQLCKDSAICRPGIPDYMLAFRKPGENPIAVEHEHGFTEYHGARDIPKSLWRYRNHPNAENKLSHWIWQQYASPVWFDIRQTNVLKYREARDGDDEKHICPLQLDAIERCVALWSREGDTLFTPFMGVGSEVYVAVKNRRRGIGIELKPSYFRQAVRNIKLAEHEAIQNDGLFSETA